MDNPNSRNNSVAKHIRVIWDRSRWRQVLKSVSSWCHDAQSRAKRLKREGEREREIQVDPTPFLYTLTFWKVRNITVWKLKLGWNQNSDRLEIASLTVNKLCRNFHGSVRSEERKHFVANKKLKTSLQCGLWDSCSYVCSTACIIYLFIFCFRAVLASSIHSVGTLKHRTQA